MIWIMLKIQAIINFFNIYMEKVCTIQFIYAIVKLINYNKAMLVFMLHFYEQMLSWKKKRTVFAAFQAKCPYNISTGFERNYFPSRNRCCYAENYMFFYSYCSMLKHCLNYKVKKACILVDDVKNFLLTFIL